MVHLPQALPLALLTEYRRHGVHGGVVLAVSGGADSMALFRATEAVANEAGSAPVVAHFDHGLRSESGRDAAWVEAQAGSGGAECFIGRSECAVSESRGVEERARKERYRFLLGVAEARGATFVATAHTADDQAETVLFQLLRGSGLRGLRGIPRRRRLSERVTLIRPFLEVSRSRIESYLDSIGQPFLTDRSNTDLAFSRNRLRHDLLPRLREGINPRLDEALRRLSRQAGEASEVVARLARRELKAALIEGSAEQVRLKCDRLRRRPRALIRETIALAWRRAGWPRQAMSFAHWDALADLVIGGGRRSLPGGVDARRKRGELLLVRAPR